MEIVKLFKDALVYPIKESKKLIMLGIFFIVMSIFNILPLFGIELNKYVATDILNIISSILLLVIILIISGYTLSITRKTINNPEGNVPEFEWVKNIIDGIKYLVLTIVYYIVPVIITLIVLYTLGAFDFISQLVNTYLVYGSINPMLESIASGNDPKIVIVLIVALVLYIIFSLLFLIAKAVLAETRSLTTAVNMIYVFKKIGKIKWRNYIIWIILFVAISTLFDVLIENIAIIPFIGIIIGLLILNPYIEMFSARALGLLYNKSNK